VIGIAVKDRGQKFAATELAWVAQHDGCDANRERQARISATGGDIPWIRLRLS
jgi:hypothetical protein